MVRLSIVVMLLCIVGCSPEFDPEHAKFTIANSEDFVSINLTRCILLENNGVYVANLCKASNISDEYFYNYVGFLSTKISS